MTDEIDYGGQSINLKLLNELALQDIVQRVNSERRRRHVIANAKNDALTINREYVQAIGRKNGDPWAQPYGAHDAYEKDSKVTHNNKSWVSLIDANVWEPGISGWREETTPANEWPEWVQPTGAHDAYKIGDKVTFNGVRYISAINSNTWSPAAYPAGWTAQGNAVR